MQELITQIQFNFNLEITDLQLLKKNDTIVFKGKDNRGRFFVVKLYQLAYRHLVEKIDKISPFLYFVKEVVKIKISSPPFPLFPTISWENEQRLLVIYEWTEGENVKQFDAVFMAKLGEIMAKLHLAASQYTATLNLLHLDNVFFQSVKPLILNKKHIFNFDDKDIEKAFGFVTQIFEKNEPQTNTFGLIHSDLHFANVLIDGNNDLIPIDFDELAYGHYLLDIAVTFNEIEDLEDAEVLKEIFIENYQKNKPLEKDFTIQMFDFQLLANILYLNWLFAEANENLLKQTKYLKFGKTILGKIIHFKGKKKIK